MWSTFMVTDEEGRTVGPAASGGAMIAPGGAPQGPAALTGMMTGRSTFGGNKRRRKTSTGHAMSEAQEGKTCLTAHYGLWKGCTKSLWVSEIDPNRESCGPAELPGASNCTYFKFFTTGENAVLFQKTTRKNLNVAAAMLALFSLFLMVMGAICITMALSKELIFFLKPASVCFIMSGVLVLLSLIVFHQSVLAFLASDHTVPLQHNLSWSVSCVGCAGAVLIVGGILFLLLALPYSPWQRCLPQKNSSS
ncbi:voltage-dependent calcium channel gamma-6 subunit-like isoform X2 [Gymnodraco acuticeps]|uniref:Voltage-dependent calcium channel gamma-6 subunit-like isoform X2 n=1 Tax=Gymnodraco acuticeps TaxID=8218 RepID=A0A6P8SY02_GYMAC|nr:voltage-dependent calcium channel gamma-6 subunit-like isoform X2 [Gymnodraco acuticeps]